MRASRKYTEVVGIRVGQKWMIRNSCSEANVFVGLKHKCCFTAYKGVGVAALYCIILNPYFKDEILSFMPLISVGLQFLQRRIMLEQNGDVKQKSVITKRVCS